MNLSSVLLLSTLSLAPIVATAQAPATSKPHPAEHSALAAHPCSKLPELSPKIPALPASAPCARPLYTINSTPPVKINDASAPVVASVTDYFGFGPTIVSLSYVDTKIGTGPPAAAHKWYTVKYTGYLVDGTVFDSSDNHPDHAPFILQQGTHGVIPGWDTGFYGMRVGGKRRLFIPYQLGYGPSNYPPAPRPTTIPGKSMLIFDIELLAQSDTSPAPKAPPTPPTPPPAATAPAPSTPAAPTPATGSTIVAGHPVGSSQPTQPATPATPQPAIPPASTSPAPPATSATPSPKPQ